MTTATTWDEESQTERPLTEAEILRMQDITTGDYHPVDEDGNPVEEDYDAEEVAAAFKAEINSYINLRGRLDPEFHSVPETDDEDADFDFYGEEISVEWKEWDRCGDHDYYRRSFPIKHLWAPSWEDAIRAEVQPREAAKKAREEALQAKARAQREAAERKQLATLLEKYGLPEGYTAS